MKTYKLEELTELLMILQSNFKKYASGGGFVSTELAAAIVEAGPRKTPKITVSSNGKK